MKERRQFVRYDVSKYPELKAATIDGPIGERLMTISIGGAGFWAPSEDFKMRLGERVKVIVSLDGIQEPITVKGEILYILPHPLESQIGRFYGIRFDEVEQEKVSEAIEQIHSLYEMGKIKEA